MSGGVRILWLARTLPVPLNAGDRIYSARLAESLAHAGAEVDFLGLASPEAPELGPEALDAKVSWVVASGKPIGAVRALLSNRPLVGARFGTPAYEARLKDMLAERAYDAVVIDQYGLAWILPLIQHAAPGSKRPVIVHIAHDFETDVTKGIANGFRGNPLRGLALRLNARRTARAERAFAAESDIIVTLTPEDRESFDSLAGRDISIVLPPGYDGLRRESRTIDKATPRKIAIVGSYRWQAKQMNLNAFLAEADPILADAGIELAIVGDAPAELQRQWEGRVRASRFMGYVDDIGAFLAECRLGLVIDAIGGGFKLKVLDYVFTRTPVAGLKPALGGQLDQVLRHFLVRSTPTDLAHEIVKIIDNDEQLNAMHEECYAVARTLYSWQENGSRLLGAINLALLSKAGQ
jgi:glycosyltransferase involved in cell wall biosynthesis